MMTRSNPFGRKISRRNVLTGAAALSAAPFMSARKLKADGQSLFLFPSDNGPVALRPVAHASFVLSAGQRSIYVDPVGGIGAYIGLPPPNIILLTHLHEDHYDPATLTALTGRDTILLCPPSVADVLPIDLLTRTQALTNGGFAGFLDVAITAYPAYNTHTSRLGHHPQGRDNGYLIDFDGLRLYVSGDTDVTPEMLELTFVDVALLCMGPPHVMDASEAATAAATFQPKIVLPYQFQSPGQEPQDPEVFELLLYHEIQRRMQAEDAPETPIEIETRVGRWYP